MTLFRLCFIMAVFFMTVSAHGLCQMRLVSLNSAIDLNLNHFPTLNLQVERQGDCGNFYITIDNGGAASYANRLLKSGDARVPIQFYKDAGRTKILRDEFETSLKEVLSSTFEATTSVENTQNFQYYAFVNPAVNQFARVGNYTGNFTIKLFEGSPASSALVDSKIVNFSYNQKSAVDISLVETGKGADLILKYNSVYTVSMKGKKQVSYMVSGQSPQGGARLPVEVVAGKDPISITVSSHE